MLARWSLVQPTPDVWLQECVIALDLIEFRGTDGALDYLVGERLPAYLERARTDAAFAAELPRFVARIRRLFSAEDIADYLRCTPAAPRTDAARLLLAREEGSDAVEPGAASMGSAA